MNASDQDIREFLKVVYKQSSLGTMQSTIEGLQEMLLAAASVQPKTISGLDLAIKALIARKADFEKNFSDRWEAVVKQLLGE